MKNQYLIYRRLFDLSDHKFLTVAQMNDLGWDVGGEAWEWRRRLWAWEEELIVECRTLLVTVSLQANIDDVWTWVPDPFILKLRFLWLGLGNGSEVVRGIHSFSF